MAVAATLVALVVLAVSLLWSTQRFLLFRPDRSEVAPADSFVAGARDVSVTTADGLRLTAWFVPPRCGATVLVAPGNAGNRSGRAPLVRALADEGMGVLLVEYRGYGGNPGSPSEAGLALDVRAARDVVRDLSPGPLVYLGESLGAAIVTELAAAEPADGLVLRSPFTSLADAARVAYGVPLGWLLRDEFPVLEQARSVSGPVAVVYGTADRTVPAAQSRAVAGALRAAGADVREVEVAGADHNDRELAAGPALVGAALDVVAAAGVPGCGAGSSD